MPFERKVQKMKNAKKKEMQKAIDLAWETPDRKAKLFQEMYFPLGKPTVEEFLKRMEDLTSGENDIRR